MTTTTETRTGTKGLAGLPFEAMLPGNKDWESASRQMLQTWKEQVDTGIKMIDAMVQGAMEMRTSQLAAATETHTRDLNIEKSVMGARTASDLLLIQLNWMTANMERSMAYWNQMFHAATDANAKLLECLRAQKLAGSDEGKASKASAAAS
jgi:phasin protein